MPRVPNYDLQQETLRPVTQARFQAPQGSPLSDLGAGLSRAGDILDRRAEIMREEDDRAAARELTLEYSRRTRELLRNGQSAYYTKQGRDAWQSFEPTQQALKKVRDELFQTARGRRQQELFASAADLRMESDLSAMAQHASRERQTYLSELSKAEAVEGLDAYLSAPDGSPEAAVALRTGKAATAAAYARLGMDEDVIASKVEEYESAAHVAKVDAMLAVDDLQGAKAYWQKNREHVDGRQRGDIRQKMHSLEMRLQARALANLAAVKDAVDDAVYSLDRGYLPPNLEQVRQAAAGTKYAVKLQASLSRARQSREFAALPPESRKVALQQLRADTEKDRAEVESLERLEKVDSDLDMLLKRDPIRYGVHAGVADDPGPLDLLTPEGVSESLRKRRGAALQVADHTGYPVSAFTQADRAVFARAMTQGTTAVKVALLGAVTEHLGTSLARETFSAMDDQIGEQHGMAGLLVTEGGVATAEKLLDGAAQRKANPSIMPKDADLLGVLAPLYDVFPGQPEKIARYAEAVRNVYAATAVESGVVDGELDEGLLKDALEQVSGGIVTFDAPGAWTGNYSFLAPKYGMTEDEVEDWIEGIQERDIEAMGGASVLGNERAAEVIRDGDAILETLARGRYLVRYGNNYLMRADGTAPFVLEYRE